MKKDITDLKKLVFDIMQGEGAVSLTKEKEEIIRDLLEAQDPAPLDPAPQPEMDSISKPDEGISQNLDFDEAEEIVEESLSIKDKEIELIKKALEKHKSNKNAAEELGISERTLYRKIKEYNIK